MVEKKHGMIIRKPDPNRVTVIDSRPSFKVERTNFIHGFIGVNKTGKSSTMREIAESWHDSRDPELTGRIEDEKYSIVANDPQNIFGKQVDEKGVEIKKGLVDLYIDLEDPDWALRCCELRNCCLILDEIRQLMPTGRSPKGMLTLFSQSFYNNVDIMWAVHNPLLAPDAATSYTTLYSIFLTFAQEGSFKRKMPNYTLCTVASTQVNEYVRKYGRGKHKLDPDYEGQGFPHIIVNCEKQTLQAINMSKEISSDLKEFTPIKK